MTGKSKHSTSSRLTSIIGGSIGNLVEWYDWYAYSAFSIYFAQVFFPKSNQTAQLLNTAGIFAVGFLMRPIGGYVFGSIADKKGRKTAMTLSVLLMSMGSLLIALLPGYNSIGVFAPTLLLVARLMQGLSVGGEYGTSATYLSEVATSERRGFYSSFQYVTLIGGQLIALGLQLLLQRFFLSAQQLQDWGWRIPFIIGAILSLTALYLRSNLKETDAFEKKEHEFKKRESSVKELLKHPRSIAIVIGLTLGGTLAFYTYTTYMQKFLINTVHLTKDQSTLLTFCSLFIFALLQPVFGALSDKVGRKPLQTDSETGVVFANRRQLEESIKLVNTTITNYLETQRDELQKTYPTYFEKFRSDGIEYDIYIGQSISPHKAFNPLYLRNLRLWQVASMAEIARLTHALLPRMEKELHTTQLLLVHTNTIDISFRNDERRFDVEGAYNIRYEVIKKRIDKVHTKTTGERLTQPGTISLVYFNNRDAEEYLKYIQYLQNGGYLLDNVEHFELEDLQGVSGLKAIRVGVSLD